MSPTLAPRYNEGPSRPIGAPLPRVAIPAIIRASSGRNVSLYSGSWNACRYSSAVAGDASGPTKCNVAAASVKPDERRERRSPQR